MPFKSKAQMRAAFGGYLGKTMKNKAKEWADVTPDIKHLPGHVKEDESNPDKNVCPKCGATEREGCYCGVTPVSQPKNLEATARQKALHKESYMLTASLLECIRAKNWHEANVLFEEIVVRKANARLDDIKTRVFMEDEKRCELCGSTKNVKMVNDTPLCAKCDPESDLDEAEWPPLGGQEKEPKRRAKHGRMWLVGNNNIPT